MYTHVKMEHTSLNKPFNPLMNYLVGFICGSLHLLIDPALELIRVSKELLQVKRVLQGSTARLSALMQGITAAEQLRMSRTRENVAFEFTLREGKKNVCCFSIQFEYLMKLLYLIGGKRRKLRVELTASLRVATSSLA